MCIWFTAKTLGEESIYPIVTLFIQRERTYIFRFCTEPYVHKGPGLGESGLHTMQLGRFRLIENTLYLFLPRLEFGVFWDIFPINQN